MQETFPIAEHTTLGGLLRKCAEIDLDKIERVCIARSVTFREVRVLWATLAAPRSNQQNIAAAASLSRASMVLLVDSLVDKKLIMRRPNEDDRRQNLLELTRRGEKLARALHAKILEAERRSVFTRLTESEMEALGALLRKMVGK